MLNFCVGIVMFLLLIHSLGVEAQATPELIIPERIHQAVKLNIRSIPAQQKAALGYAQLAVFVKQGGNEPVSNAIQGKYTIEGDYLLFKPYFPFEIGMTYTIRTNSVNADSSVFYQSFQIGKGKVNATAKVLEIFPSAHQLPENLLRFYVYFNTPMKKGQALQHIQLMDTAGNWDRHAFMEFKQELWSEDGKRLTVFFDPGRIKRGVSTNLRLGPALLKGKQYKLIISGDWQDVYGQPLSAQATKEITVVHAYRTHINVDEWVIHEPKANSLDTLSLHFDRIMDYALVQSMIQIKDQENQPLAGYWEILEQEQGIQFIPAQKWSQGRHRIVIDSRLEDVAGNNLQNLLDHSQTDNLSRSDTYQFIDFDL